MIDQIIAATTHDVNAIWRQVGREVGAEFEFHAQPDGRAFEATLVRRSERWTVTLRYRVEDQSGFGGVTYRTTTLMEAVANIGGAIRFKIGPGLMPLGSWDAMGLPHYSGGVVYTASVTFDEAPQGRVILDLGRVRGSVDVTVNGVPCGTRIWHPYRFDISQAVTTGENRLDIRVFNTLGPHFGDGNPTTFVFENQTCSGIYGPVSVSVCRSVEFQLKKA